MGAYYPIMLDITNRPCIVIGGGKIAERKVNSLLQGGGQAIHVVSPTVTLLLAQFAEAGSIRLTRREYCEEDLAPASLVFAATDDADINAQVVKQARLQGCLVNAAHDSKTSDFLVPSVVRQGDLLLAVTTSGASPALASRIRSQLESVYDERYAEGLDRLRQFRAYALDRIQDQALRHTLLKLAAQEIEEQLEQSRERLNPVEDMEAWSLRLGQLAGGVHKDGSKSR